jgi:hypothetical protein
MLFEMGRGTIVGDGETGEKSEKVTVARHEFPPRFIGCVVSSLGHSLRAQRVR